MEKYFLPQIRIGNTPMIKIEYKYKDKINHVYTKLESFNLTGSIKDRIVHYIVKKAYDEQDLYPGKEIVEATSGNTGISLAAIGTACKNPVHIFMPNWVSKERLALMKMYNAKVTLVSKEEGGFKGAINLAKRYSQDHDAFWMNQFANKNNPLAHYETTASEIIDLFGNDIDGFVSGVGSGGTLMGVGLRLKEMNPNIKIYALEPDLTPLLSQSKVFGPHKIEGIGDDFIPSIVDRDLIDEVFVLNDDDAVNMSKKLALNLGLGVGISSGANFIASVLAKEKHLRKIVTVFPDDNKKYLSTNLSCPLNENPVFISNQVKLLKYDFLI